MKICKYNDGMGRCAVSGEHCTDGPCDCEELVEYEPVRHGRWVKGVPYTCSECGKPAPEEENNSEYYKCWLSPYCPHCGAKMDAMTFEEASRYLGKQAAETLEKLKEEGHAND